jgi:hypothetical protein
MSTSRFFALGKPDNFFPFTARSGAPCDAPRLLSTMYLVRGNLGEDIPYNKAKVIC